MKTYLQTHYSKATAKAYAREITNYISNCPNAQTALYKDITEYIGLLRKRYKNPSTLGRIVASIKVYYDYLCDADIRSDNPAKSVKLRDQRSNDIQLQDLFTPQELEELLSSKERYYSIAERNQVLISIFIYQGILPQEAAAIELKDINLPEATITIKATTNTNKRVLPLKATQILLFAGYIQTARKKLLGQKQSEKLLISHRGTVMSAEDIIKQIIRRYKGYYAPREVTAITIRQSIIANLFKQGNDISAVQLFAGHKHPSTTVKYRQMEVATLQAAVNSYHPMQ